MTGEPGAHLGMLVGGIVVEDHMHHLAGWRLALNGIQETEELLVTVALHTAPDHGAVEHVGVHRRDLDQDQHGAATGLGAKGCAADRRGATWPLGHRDLPRRAAPRPNRCALSRRRADQPATFCSSRRPGRRGRELRRGTLQRRTGGSRFSTFGASYQKPSCTTADSSERTGPMTSTSRCPARKTERQGKSIVRFSGCGPIRSLRSFSVMPCTTRPIPAQ